MELIDGVPLDAYVIDNDLTPRQTLELIRRVCLGASTRTSAGCCIAT